MKDKKNNVEESNQSIHPDSKTSSEPSDEPVEELKRERKKPLTDEELREYEEWLDSLPELPRLPKKKGEHTAIFIKRRPAAPSKDKE